MKLLHFSLWSLLLVVEALSGQDLPPVAFELTPDLPYRAERSNPVTYDVQFSVIVTAPDKTKKLRVWVPVPSTDYAQQISGSRFSTFPLKVEPKIDVEKAYGNQFAYFEFDSPQGAQIIQHQFQIKTWELCWHVDPAEIVTIRDWPASFDRFRNSDTQAVIVDDRFAKVLKEIIPEPTNAATDLDGVMKWVQDHFQYDHHAASLRASSEHGLVERRGHCSDYHSFCASLGRLLGVPTRVTYGIHPFPKNSPSHCKLEAFLAPYGWVSFDVSETQKLVNLIRSDPQLDAATRQELISKAEARLASGFRDNTWYLQSRGTDYDLIPPAAKRVAVVRTAYVEADGVALPEPDPGDPSQTKFAWMTAHQYLPDREVTYPFKDWSTLNESQRP